MRKSETKRLNAANSRHLSWKSHRERRAHRRNSTGCIHNKVGLSEERSGNFHQEYERHTVGTAERGQPSVSSDARRATQADDRLERTQEFSENCGMRWARPQDVRHKKHSVACMNRQEEWKTKTIPQPERVTHSADAEMQQDTQAATSTSTVHTPMTGMRDSTGRPVAKDIRDTDQPEHGNDESENPGEWTPVKRIRLKSKPLVQSKRP